jgi:hypothetical protein
MESIEVPLLLSVCPENIAIGSLLTRNSEVTTSSHSQSESGSHQHPHGDSEGATSSVIRIQRLAMFLEAHFGEVELHMPEANEEEQEGSNEPQQDPSLLVQLDDADAQINLVSLVCFPTLSPAVLLTILPCLL